MSCRTTAPRTQHFVNGYMPIASTQRQQVNLHFVQSLAQRACTSLRRRRVLNAVYWGGAQSTLFQLDPHNDICVPCRDNPVPVLLHVLDLRQNFEGIGHSLRRDEYYLTG